MDLQWYKDQFFFPLLLSSLPSSSIIGTLRALAQPRTTSRASFGAGNRATTPGYGSADGVQQKFTAYEHDSETTLEFAQARYMSNVQGRFTTPDPFIPSIDLEQSQSMNR
jgi:hypothetical protein